MFYGTDNIPQKIQDILHIQIEFGKYPRIFYEIFSVPQNVVMDLNNFFKKILLLIKKQPLNIFVIFHYIITVQYGPLTNPHYTTRS